MDKDLLKLINEIVVEEYQDFTEQTDDETGAFSHTSKSRQEMLPEQTTFPTEPLPFDGFIETKNNQFIIVNPKKNGRQPLLQVSKDITLLVNGRRILKDTIVTETDKIEWKIKKHLKPFYIFVSKDNMQVFLKCTSSINKEYKLKNKPKSFLFLPELEVKKRVDFQQIYHSIMETIYAKEITVKIDKKAIFQELKNPTFEPVLIAKGIPVTEPKDASLELLFAEKTEEVFEEVEGRIDFRNRVKIPSVNKGDLVAIIHPAVEGKEGKDVYGNILHPKQPKRIQVKAKENVNIFNNKVYALRSGRPTITGKVTKYINILPQYKIRQNVDMKTGNICFNGDVVVYGNVHENMRIEALGAVTIYGSVYSATIISAQDIYIENVAINSKIYAGDYGILYHQVYEIVQALKRDIHKLAAAFKQIITILNQQEHTKHFKQKHVFLLLIEQKFQQILHFIKKFRKITSEAENLKVKIPAIISKFQTMLSILFEKRYLLDRLNIAEFLQKLQDDAKKVLDSFDHSVQEDSNITIGEADMCVIRTNGSVTIRKRGVVNSRISAGKNCFLASNKTVVKGGTIFAGRQILGGRIGTKSFDYPHLIAKERIFLKEILCGKITVNNKTKWIEEPLKNQEFIFDPSTNSIIHYSLEKQKNINEILKSVSSPITKII